MGFKRLETRLAGLVLIEPEVLPDARGFFLETYRRDDYRELGIDVVRKILELTGRDDSLIEHVTDRLGHDRRYSLSSEKTADLGWTPEVRFEEGLRSTVEWYRDNSWWWEPIRSDEYREYYERQYGQKLRS